MNNNKPGPHPRAENIVEYENENRAIIVGTLETVPRVIKSRLELKIERTIENVWNTVLLESARILRRVLETDATF